MLSEEDKRRIEAEEQYRSEIRAKESGHVQKTDFGEHVRKTRKNFMILFYVFVGIVVIALLIGQIDTGP